MKYPIVLLFRYDKYSSIDSFIIENKESMDFSVLIINDSNDLNKMFDVSFHILMTFGPNVNEYIPVFHSILPQRMRRRWVHYSISDISDISKLNNELNRCYMNNVTNLIRPIFSLFTTCYNTYDKIFRAYSSIKNQKLKDWEWVILDDSPEDEHFNFLKSLFKNDKRVRLYNRSENSGSIGNVKNEAVMLCRGKYVIEMDHDDFLLPDCLLDATNIFDNNLDIGFIYTDFANLYENGVNFSYGDFFGLGYSGYYCQKYNNKWINVAISPNINNITLSNIVSIPNHARIWRRSVLLEIGNYSEFLPVSDDYELILRTVVNTKVAKLPKLGYIQYMNNNGNNFSLIRNKEINRLCKELYNQCYQKYKINDFMKNMDSYEEKYNNQIWKRKNYNYKYCNKIINVNYKKQYCIIGLDVFCKNKNILIELYKDNSNDFLLLDNCCSIDELTKELDDLKLDNFKCYSLKNSSYEELEQYFHLIYRSCENYEIIKCLKSLKVTIITPCIRPENLIKIKESINFNYVNEWIIVYDGTKISSLPSLPSLVNDKIKEYIHIGDGISGNPQRNFALNLIKNNTYLYFLDDDNIIHPELYKLLDTIEPGHMYTFNQSRPKNTYPYKDILLGDNIEIFNIDTAMFLIDFNLCKDIRWDSDKYNADGYYIKECYEKNKESWIYVNKTMSYYNKL